jgi:glycosyltransferase involved in cell wall biosynthesis
MRILMLSQFYPPIVGGEEQHVRSLSTELAARGHDVAVVTLWHEGMKEFELDEEVRVYRIRSSVQHMPWLFVNNKRQYAPPFPDPGALLALRSILTQERPEIVHAHNWLVYSFLPLKTWSKARLIVTLHNYNLICAKTSLMYKDGHCSGPESVKCLNCSTQFYGLAKGIPVLMGTSIMNIFQRGAVDMFLPVSQAVAEGNRLVSSSRPFEVMPNFIRNEIDPLRSSSAPYLSQLPPEGYLLFVGAFNHLKGVGVLLQAYARIEHAPPLVLIGYKTAEWEFLSKDCPANVFILTDWPHDAVMEAWRHSVLAIAPSVGSEPCSTAVIEAMLAGVPVIASRNGGFLDLVADEKTGLLVEPGDPVALQQAIERLLEDSDLRQRMGQAARQHVKNFQAGTVVPRIEQVYKRVL